LVLFLFFPPLFPPSSPFFNFFLSRLLRGVRHSEKAKDPSSLFFFFFLSLLVFVRPREGREGMRKPCSSSPMTSRKGGGGKSRRSKVTLFLLFPFPVFRPVAQEEEGKKEEKKCPPPFFLWKEFFFLLPPSLPSFPLSLLGREQKVARRGALFPPPFP